jgi:hypothetical protein
MVIPQSKDYLESRSVLKRIELLIYRFKTISIKSNTYIRIINVDVVHKFLSVRVGMHRRTQAELFVGGV